MRGLLVIDTLEAQWTYEFIGKIPPYIPPNIRTGLVDFSMPESLRNSEPRTGRKTIIKDNIELAKIPRRPRTAMQPHRSIVRPVAGPATMKTARSAELASATPMDLADAPETPESARSPA
jgi:hypothetical protein